MRTTAALAILALGFPALPAGAAQRDPSATPFPSRPGNVVVLRPETRTYQAQARRVSPTAARSAETTLSAADDSAHGVITMEARQLQGAEALDVEGTAPARVPVTITLLAVVSSDIPTIVVSRHDVVTDVNGRFGAVIPIASAYERGTVLRVVATSAPDVASATTELVVQAPNTGVTVPLEQLPH